MLNEEKEIHSESLMKKSAHTYTSLIGGTKHTYQSLMFLLKRRIILNMLAPLNYTSRLRCLKPRRQTPLPPPPLPLPQHHLRQRQLRPRLEDGHRPLRTLGTRQLSLFATSKGSCPSPPNFRLLRVCPILFLVCPIRMGAHSTVPRSHVPVACVRA